jgi:hypothetical protein
MGRYSKGVKTQKEDGAHAGKDSDPKILDDPCCRFRNIPPNIAYCTSPKFFFVLLIDDI